MPADPTKSEQEVTEQPPGGSRKSISLTIGGQEAAESSTLGDSLAAESLGHTLPRPLREAHSKVGGPRGLERSYYPPTKGRAGGKLPSGNTALRSPARSFSEASRKAATNQAWASQSSWRTLELRTRSSRRRRRGEREPGASRWEPRRSSNQGNSYDRVQTVIGSRPCGSLTHGERPSRAMCGESFSRSSRYVKYSTSSSSGFDATESTCVSSTDSRT